MVYRGHVQNGVIVLDDPRALRDGTEVMVKPLFHAGKKTPAAKQRTVGRVLASLAGKAKDLPPDAARNLDHYLYGHAKQ